MSDISAVVSVFNSIKRSLLAESFEGQLLDLQHQPIVGAEVCFGDEVSTKTALTGRFSVELKTGAYTVSIRYEGACIENIDTLVINGNTETLKTIIIDRALLTKTGKDPENTSTQDVSQEGAQSQGSKEALTIIDQTHQEDTEQMSVQVKDVVISGKTVPELYTNVLMYLTQHKLIPDSVIPYSTGSKRHLIAKEPIHPSGKDFFKSVEVDGYYVECNKPKKQAPADMQKFIDSLNL